MAGRSRQRFTAGCNTHGKHHPCRLAVSLLFVVLVAIVSGSAAAAPIVQVELMFQGLSQSIFDEKYANDTLAAVAASAGVPAKFITRAGEATPAAAAAASVASTRGASSLSSAGNNSDAAAPTAAKSNASKSSSTNTSKSAPTKDTNSTNTSAIAPATNSTKSNSSSSSGDSKSKGSSETTKSTSNSSTNTNSSSKAEPGTTVQLLPTKAQSLEAATPSSVEVTAPGAEPGEAAPPTATVAAATSVAAATAGKKGESMVFSSSDKSSTASGGARRLLLQRSRAGGGRHLTAEAPGMQAHALYNIQTGSADWASADAIKTKLREAAAPPDYTFFSNLRRRSVPYEPTMMVDGMLILRGSEALSGRGAGSPSSSAPTAHMKSDDASGMPMVGPLPLWVFIAILVLGALVAVAMAAALGVLSWRGLKAFKACYSEEVKKDVAQQDQFIKGGPQAGDGLIMQPGGGYAPTQGALDKLNASFPTKTGSVPRGPESVVSNHTAVSNHTVATSAVTAATTARSTAGLMANPDGKRSRAASVSKKDSSVDPDQAAYEYFKPYAQQGKQVPILPHSRLVKPGPAAIKVPAARKSTMTTATPIVADSSAAGINSAAAAAAAGSGAAANAKSINTTNPAAVVTVTAPPSPTTPPAPANDAEKKSDKSKKDQDHGRDQDQSS